MRPARGRVLVQRIDTPETVPGGRVILTPQTRAELTAWQMDVVAVGALSSCDDVDCERPHVVEHPGFPIDRAWLAGAPRNHPCAVRAGDWVVVAPRSLSETDQPALFCCHQDDILAVLQQAPV